MLAMCVRKTADTGGTPTSMQAPGVPFANSTGTTAKRKLKALRSRGSGSTKKQADSSGTVTAGTSTTTSSSSALKKQQHHHHQHHQQVSQKTTTATTGCSTVDVDCTVKVRDDAEGHLIYRKGDVVDSRCKFVSGILGTGRVRVREGTW